MPLPSTLRSSCQREVAATPPTPQGAKPEMGQKVKYRTEPMFSALPPATDIRRGHRNDKLPSSLCIGQLLSDACFPKADYSSR